MRQPFELAEVKIDVQGTCPNCHRPVSFTKYITLKLKPPQQAVDGQSDYIHVACPSCANQLWNWRS